MNPADVQAGPIVTVVMSGLDNPRGLAFDSQGDLYVAEAGRGGSGPCVAIGAANYCYGPTGAVSRLAQGVQTRVATGLPSIALTGGTRAEGPNDIVLAGGSVYAITGLEADPALRTQASEFSGFGQLVQIASNGAWTFATDIAAHEAATNPDGGAVDSNPFGLLATPAGLVVADAGANALLSVSGSGQISTLAVLPPVQLPNGTQTDAVPTALTVGPDGAYYFGQLTGAPFVNGAASVYRLEPGQHTPTVFLTGFKTIVDLVFDPSGDLLVLEHSSGPTGLSAPGRLLEVAPDGTRTTILDGLLRPVGLAIGPDGAFYVSTGALSAGTGEVLRIQVPEPGSISLLCAAIVALLSARLAPRRQ
jgi:hypothetical protein